LKTLGRLRADYEWALLLRWIYWRLDDFVFFDVEIYDKALGQCQSDVPRFL
jgi:hypothetical protein